MVMKKEFFIFGIVLVFALGFVLAAHTVTLSDGQSWFKPAEDVAYVFNVSVNNTDVALNANISQVNITIPSTFTFVGASNGTSVSFWTFVNTSTVLSWTNTSVLIPPNTTSYFWFNANASTPGNYTINVTTVNSTSIVNTSLVVVVNDTASPSATSWSPVTNYNSSSTNVSFILSCGDNVNPDVLQVWGNWTGTWHANQTNSTPVNGTNWTVSVVIADGTYIWAAWCNDSAANSDYADTNRTLTVDTTYPLIDFGLVTDGNNTNLSQSWIYVNVSVTEINERNISFRLYNSSSSVNITNFTDGTRVINWTGLSDGVYTYNVTDFDSSGNSNATATRTITIDVTDPTSSITCSPTSVFGGDTIACSCTATDATSGVLTTVYSASPSTAVDGTFTNLCTVTDYAGNSVIGSTSYTVSPRTGGGSGSSGGGSTSFWTSGSYTANTDQLSQGYSKAIARKQRIKFTLSGEEHHVGIRELGVDSVKVEVSSIPQQKFLSIGEIWKVELTGDNFYDLSVVLNSIVGNKADLTIKSINEEIIEEQLIQDAEEEDTGPVVGITGEAIGDAEGGSLVWIWIFIVIIIIITIILLVRMMKRKK
ncbi:MAG: hypothetical protein KKB31_06155 [Nanoarchaeota archaeon]|nr:hypothetical protein [Nanoarchaeota archaeon]